MRFRGALRFRRKRVVRGGWIEVTAQESGADAQIELRRTEFNFSGHRHHHMANRFPGKIEFCTSDLCPVTSESLRGAGGACVVLL